MKLPNKANPLSVMRTFRSGRFECSGWEGREMVMLLIRMGRIAVTGYKARDALAD
jgi:hypothetical protein